jgi:hypothetical protein
VAVRRKASSIFAALRIWVPWYCARLQKGHELGKVVDRRRQPNAEDRNAATTIGLDRVHHRRVEDVDRPVDFVG